MNRILLEPHELTAGGTAYVRGPRADHIRSVLRVGPGAVLRVGVVDGRPGWGTVHQVTGTQVILACAFDPIALEPEPADLLLALPRPKVLRRLVPQVAALGIRHLFLTNAWRVEKPYFDTHVLEAFRLRAGLMEGASQSGSTGLPTVSVHRHLRKLLEEELDERLPAHTARLVAHPSASLRLGRWTPDRAMPPRAVLAVGPEGGWIDREQALFEKHGFQSVSLGPRILRSDTACISLLAVLRERLAAG